MNALPSLSMLSRARGSADGALQQTRARQDLEALLLRPLVENSGLLKGMAPVAQGIFADALADALAGQGVLKLGDNVLGDRAAAADADALAGAVVRGGAVSSAFGERVDPLTGAAAFHHGLDVAAPLGAAVHTPRGGMVARVSEDPDGLGRHVVVNHAHGLSTTYGHLSDVCVHVGQTLQPGEALGRVGQTGRATGPHVHLEVRQDGVAVDPTRALMTRAP